MGSHLATAAAAIPTVAQIDLVSAARDIVLSPGGAIAVILVILWALLYRRMIPKGTHETEIGALKESYERALKERDAQIVKLEARADRWEQYALFGRQRLRETLDEVGAPPARPATVNVPPGSSAP